MLLITDHSLGRYDESSSRVCDSPTHISATHAFSMNAYKFQFQIPRKLDKKFYIPGISMIHWINYNFLKWKNLPKKKDIPIFNPGIQPRHHKKWHNFFQFELSELTYFDWLNLNWSFVFSVPLFLVLFVWAILLASFLLSLPTTPPTTPMAVPAPKAAIPIPIPAIP